MKQKYAYVGRFSESGSKNSFYRMKNSKYGFKSFPTKELAEFAHAVQSELSTADLAPKVYSPVAKIRIPSYFVKQTSRGYMKTIKEMVLSDWGYLTEVAKPYFCNDPDCGSSGCAWEQCCENYHKIRKLVKDIEQMGIGYNDYHSGNLGYVIRNKKRVLVVIDLGRESIYDADSRYPDVEIYDDYDGTGGCSCSACVAARNQEEIYA